MLTFFEQRAGTATPLYDSQYDGFQYYDTSYRWYQVELMLRAHPKDNNRQF